MNFKTTLSLLVLLVVVLGVSWYLGVFSANAVKSEGEAPRVVQAEKILLISPKLQDLKIVRLELTGRGAVAFEKTGETWRVAEPVSVPAVSYEVADLVSAFEEARKLETVTPGQGQYEKLSLKDLGLDEPVYTITFEDKGGKHTYLVGKNVVASENTYVTTPDKKEVIIVDQNLKTKVKKDLAEYRDKQIWDLKKDKITELSLANREGQTFKFVKGDNEKWLMLAPVRAPASSEPVNSAITAVSSLRAQEYADDKAADLARYGLDKPAWTMTLVETEKIEPTSKPGDKTPATQPTVKRTEHIFAVGNQTGLKADQVFAKLADKSWVVIVKEEDIKKLLPNAVAWREKKLLDLDKNDVSKVQVTFGGRDVVLAKVDQAWKLQADGQLVATDSAAVTALVDTLTGLEAANFVDQPDDKFIKKNKLDAPVATVKLTGGTKVEPVELMFGEISPSGVFRYVKRSGLEYVAVVANEKLAPVFKPALAYRSKKIIEFNVDNVRTVSVTRDKTTTMLERTNTTAPWKVTSPVVADADAESVKDLLMGLLTLEATEIVGKGNVQNFGLANPQVLVKLTTETQVPVPVATAPTTQTKPASRPKPQMQTVRKTLAFAASKSDGKFYAVCPEAPEVLVARIPDKAFADLTKELVDRKAFADLSVEKIDRVEIKRPGSEPVLFTKVKGEWTYPADPVFSVDGEKFKNILNTLANVKARRYADFTAADKHGTDRPHFKITASEGQKSWTLSAGQTESKQNRYAQASSRPWIFVLAGEDYNRLDVDLKSLAKLTQPTPVPAATD